VRVRAGKLLHGTYPGGTIASPELLWYRTAKSSCGGDGLEGVARLALARFGNVGSTDGGKLRAVGLRMGGSEDEGFVELCAYDSRIQFATFVGGSRRQNAHWYSEEAMGVLVNPQRRRVRNGLHAR